MLTYESCTCSPFASLLLAIRWLVRTYEVFVSFHFSLYLNCHCPVFLRPFLPSLYNDENITHVRIILMTTLSRLSPPENLIPDRNVAQGFLSPPPPLSTFTPEQELHHDKPGAALIRPRQKRNCRYLPEPFQ